MLYFRRDMLDIEHHSSVLCLPRDLPTIKDIGLLYVSRDMPDITYHSGYCADSVIYQTSRIFRSVVPTANILRSSHTNFLNIRHKGQRPTRTTSKKWSVPGACSLIHVMQAVGAPGTQTFPVRVGFCPLLSTRRRFATIFSRTHRNENYFFLSFFTKDG